LHHLTHAANQLDEAFGKTSEITRCGAETTDAIDGMVNGGLTEYITIDYNSEIGGWSGWKDFIEKLRVLEDEWELEGKKML
jgi:hypothetical protein